MTLVHTGPREGIVIDPRSWITSAGYEFWLIFGNADTVGGYAATNTAGLSGFGWVDANTVRCQITEGSTADFLSSSDLDPTRLVNGTAVTITLGGPRIFGSYAHGLQAARFLGAMPTRLSMEFFGRFAIASNNETTSFIGFHASGAADTTAAGCGGAIRSDGANFCLSSTSSEDVGAAVDTNWHRFKITWSSATTEWFIDDASQGTKTTEPDVWPQAFRVINEINTPELAWLRVYYEL